MKKDEISWAISTHRRGEKYIKNFGRRAWREDISIKT
jgi:hypothetical protein